MPKLEIDGKTIEVPAGTRLLQAARQLGITVPTMCYLEGMEPYTSCMICLVKDEGKGKLVPACSAIAEDGLKITTENDETRKARKFNLELLFSDHVGDCEAPCHRVCKSHINIPAMIRHIQEDNMVGAVEVLRASVGNTGLPCHGCEGTCEPGCRRGKAEAPVGIRNLVRFVHEYGAKEQKWKPGENDHKEKDKRFNCAIGKLKEGEIDKFLLEANPIPRVEPSEGGVYNRDEALAEASRCMHCDCRKADACALRDYADYYGVKQREYQPDDRKIFYQIRQHGDIIFEPEKCIKCGLCIRITEEKKEKLGLTWVDRGFNIGVATPFNTELSSALTTTAALVIDACPTAALAYRDHFAEARGIGLRGTAEAQPVEFRRDAIPVAERRPATPNHLVPMAVEMAGIPVKFGKPSGGGGCGGGGCGSGGCG
ncbi:MAG TPA: 2Fe-2S iron-sulfur cluster-binding protein [Planctomycetota bacterium]|nr:2Fe-2S iron-sulfur cluster-binding protein [Planctomycetota bacterium]